MTCSSTPLFRSAGVRTTCGKRVFEIERGADDLDVRQREDQPATTRQEGLQLHHERLAEVPRQHQQVVGLDEVVARVQVARVLDRELQPAGLGVHAHPAGLPVEVGQRRVEHRQRH